MYTSFLTILTVVASVASALPANSGNTKQLYRRDPSDQSGNSRFIYQCEETIIPSPGGGGGAGEGGYGFFSDRFSFIDRDGVKVVPDACEYTNSGHFCTNCIFNSKYLSSPTNATGCYNPPAGMYQGCSLSFQYNNYPYDTQEGQDKCGHQVSYPGFSDIGKAICYFDDGWSG
ncbi:hypothetical protein LA080_008161 [Diaporthe eres]|uniref:Uncharacterized protein n=1 Tax=Diaporthe vaccinii TaxID=105482 RepID=A0ABR4EPD4_9PEZI|nr:hypothetical protein LA080_008161 [Diaporthe eres]